MNKNSGMMARWGTSRSAWRSHVEASLETMSNAVMLVDRDLLVRYVNAASRRLLAQHLEPLRGLIPGIDPDNMEGVCIEAFIADATQRRRMSADPENVSFKAELRAGAVTLALDLHANRDGGGKYVGAMLEWRDVTAQREGNAIMAATHKAQAVIEFALDGTILTANDNFLQTLGYALEDIQGKHHGMFVEPQYRESNEYRRFWEKLRRGEYDAGQYKRLGRGGKEVWIQASYNPVLDPSGNAYKVVKFATDITADKLRAADFDGQLRAVGKAQAVIEFTLDGKILTANDNFLNALGYSLEEIKGKHHGLFVEPSYRDSDDYRLFWDKLGRGEYDAGQYKRIGKGGKEVWIQATYNPILDMNGKPFKVVKYASDVTAQVKTSQALDGAVRETQAMVQAAIDGDLSQRISLDGKTGQVGELSASANALVDAMVKVVEGIKLVSSEVHSGAVEISEGNMHLSERTEAQASSLEETAAAMEQMTSAVKQSADNAGQANQLASAARQRSEHGGSIVAAAVAAMAEISSASKKIADIIGVIDEIAFQTNLLALNAAVEAARAGEQGRGFAVVASEVRSLAGRSATAAKEIKALIKDSVAKVEEGTKLVDESGKALGEIGSAVAKVTDVVAEIASSSQEQASGIEQVNKAVLQMDESTQQNAALVEEAAAASQSIVEKAKQLSDVVAHYRLGTRSDETVTRRQPGVSAPRSVVREKSATAGVERRSPSRAWARPAGRAAASSTAAAAARPKAVRLDKAVGANSGDENEWQEF